MNILNSVWHKLLAIVTLLLLSSSILHRVQLMFSEQQYKDSFLIQIETLSIVVLLAIILIDLVLFFTYLILGKSEYLSTVFFRVLIALIVCLLAALIDMPTLVYAT